MLPRTLRTGDVVLMDGGCSVDGYRSDISRTVVFGTPTARQRSVWEAQKRAMRTYRANKRFFTQGIFYGLDENTHAHTLPDIREAMINAFNLEDQPVHKTIRLRLGEIGLHAGTTGQHIGAELSIDVSIPARGHQLLHVSAKPNAEPRISLVVSN